MLKTLDNFEKGWREQQTSFNQVKILSLEYRRFLTHHAVSSLQQIFSKQKGRVPQLDLVQRVLHIVISLVQNSLLHSSTQQQTNTSISGTIKGYLRT